MRKLGYIIITCLAWALFGTMIVFAQKVEVNVPDVVTKGEVKKCWSGWWWCFSDSNDPLVILKEIVDNDDADIIETKLDAVMNTSAYGDSFTISWTLESIRQQVSPYIQRIAFIGLAAAVVLIIYNGVLLVTTPLSPDQVANVKKRMIYIASWVALITWFYFIMKILLAIFVDIFVK